jgi:serine protease AprX
MAQPPEGNAGNGPADRDERILGFTPDVLDKTVIALPLFEVLDREQDEVQAGRRQRPKLHDVIIDLNLEYKDGREAARDRVGSLIAAAVAAVGTDEGQGLRKRHTDQYLFARLEGAVIRELVRRDDERKPQVISEGTGASIAHRAVYRIWPDFKIQPLISRSISTVKADAARISFSALGEKIVWAVLDSGIDGDHPHFQEHRNLQLDPALQHQDFTSDTGDGLKDESGHGTHVAGIIAGYMKSEDEKEDAPRAEGKRQIRAFARHRDEGGRVTYDVVKLDEIWGMAPKCKLLSLKVLDKDGEGTVSNLIAAISYVQEINGYGRRLKIHGVNMSVGYNFDPDWFACGQSPLCVEVDQLVRSGVTVVVAAGNTGYGFQRVAGQRAAWAAGLDLTINDPGNADLAITVGSTHREMPHVYGVSYFSSKGPTGDGRIKPDLVAPGEKILSCAAGKMHQEAQAKGADCNYIEHSGTSMAAPHVSGVIAAFLSVRREFIGRPERVKELFLSTATDLKRDRHFQGHGLVDLMRAIQSV